MGTQVDEEGHVIEHIWERKGLVASIALIAQSTYSTLSASRDIRATSVAEKFHDVALISYLPIIVYYDLQSFDST